LVPSGRIPATTQDHFAPSNADLVDNAAREGTADNAASDAMATPGKNLTSMFGVIIMMQPGANGISLIGSEIRSVRQGSIGARAGVRVGDYIVAANGAPFKEGSLGPLESGTVPYTLTVSSPNRVAFIMANLLHVPAALMGCVLLICLVPSYCSQQRLGPDWRNDLLARSITCPAGIVAFGSFACGSLALAFLTVGNNGFRFVDHVANALYVFGLIRCLKSVLASPLLSIQRAVRHSTSRQALRLILTSELSNEEQRFLLKYSSSQLGRCVYRQPLPVSTTASERCDPRHQSSMLRCQRLRPCWSGQMEEAVGASRSAQASL